MAFFESCFSLQNSCLDRALPPAIERAVRKLQDKLLSATRKWVPTPSAGSAQWLALRPKFKNALRGHFKITIYSLERRADLLLPPAIERASNYLHFELLSAETDAIPTPSAGVGVLP